MKHKLLSFFLTIFIIFCSGLQVFSNPITEIRFESYMRNLEIDIRKNWRPPIRHSDYTIETRFKIDKIGNMSDCKIINSSNDKLIDEMALSAIKKATPFKPLPKGFKGSSITVKFTFKNPMRDNLGAPTSSYFLSTAETDSMYENLSASNKEIYDQYLKRLEKVLNIYIPENQYIKRKTIDLSFTLLENGKIQNIEITRPSDSQIYDNLVKSAIEKVGFESIPKELGLKELKLKYRVLSGTF